MVEVLNKFFDLLFGWAVVISPIFGIILVSFILSLLSTIAWKYLTDQILLKSLKEKTNSLREEIKKHKGDPKKMAELNSKMAKEGFENMKIQYKQSIKPMIATLIPFLFVFIWIRKTYEPFGTLFLGLGGIGAYILFSFIFSMILRSVMKVY
ncbi:DUF106 domain-containing protein [Candidatus Woesearchaeota archaeon]|nr:DUF106 domain-containing protein [Candidatus Woesearchaeota archaeon]